jgi:DNA repair protein RecO (recombination protein O)
VGEHESLPRLYVGLTWAIEALQAGEPSMDVTLRSFEKLLMQELGYGLDFAHDAASGDRVLADSRYRLDLERGFVADDSCVEADSFVGQILLDIASEDFGSIATRRAAKRIFRRALAPLLGPKPLTSRRLLFRGQA